MMIYFLFFLLVSAALFFFLLFDRDILSPSVMVFCLFAFSTFFAIINVNNWQFEIHLNTVLIIMSSLFVFSLGECLIQLLYKKRYMWYNNFTFQSEIKISKVIVLIICVYELLFSYIYYLHVLNLAHEAGYDGSGFMLYYARVAILNKTGEFFTIPRWVSWSKFFGRTFWEIFLYIFLYNRIIAKKLDFSLLFPVVCHLLFFLFSTDRTDFICLIAFWIVIEGCFFSSKENSNKKNSFRILLTSFVGVLLFFVVFIIIGSFRSDFFSKKAFQAISLYTGLSLPSLDWYFNCFDVPHSEYIGEHTLIPLYSFLRKFSNKIPKLYAPWSEFPSFNGVKGNVFTVIRRYHQDYGFLGLYLMMFFLGFFYSFLFYKFKNSKKNFGLFFYALIISPITLIAIEERFLLTLSSPSVVLHFLVKYVLFEAFVNKRLAIPICCRFKFLDAQKTNNY